MTTHPFDYLPLPNGARFIFTPCPGTKEAGLAESVATLKQAGASAIITVLPDAEINALNVPELGRQTEGQQISWFQLPVEDNCPPEHEFMAAFTEAREELLALIEQQATIAIHCRGGSGRTGLIAAILLLESGMPWQEVRTLVQSIRPKALTLAPHTEFLAQHYSL